MLENLRIAIRKQRKLILIFFLTIFLPALTLSVFGVRATHRHVEGEAADTVLLGADALALRRGGGLLGLGCLSDSANFEGGGVQGS